jgi:alpha-beta hydrolase superfamily lysophospholipase
MVANIAFHPSRQEPQFMDATSGDKRDGVFLVPGGEKVSYRLYVPPGTPQIVVYFWHGNSEVCTAVDECISVFAKSNAAVLSIDYRGYSWGTGQPSLSKLCGDAEACFEASIPLLEKAGCGSAKRVAMGRSIGATCAVHIAAKKASKVHGLVVDSGLMSIKGLPMVATMGPMFLGGPDVFAALAEPFDTLGSMEAVSCPLLVMHGKNDEIVPFAQAQQCLAKCQGGQKVFKGWENAGHNDVLMMYASLWEEALTELFGKALAFTEPFPAGVTVETHSLSSADLNGLKGVVKGPASAGERYTVVLPAPTGPKALKPVNLKVVEGGDESDENLD